MAWGPGRASGGTGLHVGRIPEASGTVASGHRAGEAAFADQPPLRLEGAARRGPRWERKALSVPARVSSLSLPSPKDGEGAFTSAPRGVEARTPPSHFPGDLTFPCAVEAPGAPRALPLGRCKRLRPARALRLAAESPVAALRGGSCCTNPPAGWRRAPPQASRPVFLVLIERAVYGVSQLVTNKPMKGYFLVKPLSN